MPGRSRGTGAGAHGLSGRRGPHPGKLGEHLKGYTPKGLKISLIAFFGETYPHMKCGSQR